MTSLHRQLENIQPKLRPLNLKVRDDEIIVGFTDSHQEPQSFRLPLKSKEFLDSFINEKSISETTLELANLHKEIDFRLLRKTLFDLYWKGAIVNTRDFRSIIEQNDTPPALSSQLSSSLGDHLEYDEDQFSIFYFIPFVFLGLGLLLLNSYDLHFLSLVFIPSVYFNLKFLLSLMNHVGQNERFLFSVEVSSLGIFWKFIAKKTSDLNFIPWVLDVLINFMLYIFGCYYFLQLDPEKIQNAQSLSSYGIQLCFLLFALQLSPMHDTEVFTLVQSLQDKKSKIVHPIFWLFGCIYAFFSLVFIFKAFTNTPKILKVGLGFESLLILCLLGVSILLIYDLLDAMLFAANRTNQAKLINIAEKFQSMLKSSNLNIFKIIKNVPIFFELQDEAIEKIASNSQILNLPAGACIFKQGDTSTDLYVNIKGRVGIYTKNPEGIKKKILEITPGQIFGEGAFLLKQTRSAYAFSIENSYLLKIPRADFFRNKDHKSDFLKHFQKKIWAFHAIQRSPIFQDCPIEVIMQMIYSGEIIDVQTQQKIIQQGDLPNSFYAIISGEFDVFEGSRYIRTMLSEDIFGEIGLLWSRRRTTSVICKTAGTIIKIPAHTFWKILSQNSKLGMHLQVMGEKRLKA